MEAQKRLYLGIDPQGVPCSMFLCAGPFPHLMTTIASRIIKASVFEQAWFEFYSGLCHAS